MDFIKISLENYVKIRLQFAPESNEQEVREKLENALATYKAGEKCECGNEIWVIGSAFMDTGCYYCLTGNFSCNKEYELSDALPKKMEAIDFIPPEGNYYLDDGTPCNPDLFPMPTLCMSCKKKDDPRETILCNLTRMDQSPDREFKCYSYRPIDE